MSPSRLAGLFVLVVMVVVMDVLALPHGTSTSLQRHKRQQQQDEINDDTLVCILLGIKDGSCGSAPTDPFSPSDPPPPPDPLPTPAPLPNPLPPVEHITPCTCTPHWQCKDEKSGAVVTGSSLTSIVLDLRSNVGCGAPEEVCCVNVDKNVPPPTPRPGTLSCGQRNVLGIGNTFFGFEKQQSQFGEFPWTVVITSSRRSDGTGKPLFISGGSLIHPQMVMSVAHKFRNYTADKLMVRAGDWNLATDTEMIPYQEIRVTDMVTHPAYSGDPYHYYDVVLLVLERPVVLGTTVNTICLPLSEQDYLPDKCIFSGWGKKKFSDASKYQEVMKAVSMPLVDLATCRAALQRTRLGPSFNLHDSFLCAGGEVEDQDACTGDGGSPLVCPLRSDSSRYVQVGVVAWGIECGRMGVPGVYADVLKVGLWIDQILGDHFGSSREQAASRAPSLDIRSSL